MEAPGGGRTLELGSCCALRGDNAKVSARAMPASTAATLSAPRLPIEPLTKPAIIVRSSRSLRRFCALGALWTHCANIGHSCQSGPRRSSLQVAALLQVALLLPAQRRRLLALVDVRLELERPVLLVLAAAARQRNDRQRCDQCRPTHVCHIWPFPTPGRPSMPRRLALPPDVDCTKGRPVGRPLAIRF